METKANPVDSRKNIRWMAVGLTPFVWFIGIAFAVHYGESIPRAMAISAIQAVSGLAAWTCFHLITRQNGGILISALAIVFPAGQTFYHPELSLYYDVISRISSGLALVLGFCIMSILLRAFLILRAFRKSKRAAGKSKRGQASSPLWDKEVDLPSTK